MHTTLTFDQMKGKAERTLGIVLWAKNVRNVIAGAALMAGLSQALKMLVVSLSRDQRLATLTDDQARELAGKLRELHSNLDFVLHRNKIVQCKKSIVFGPFVRGIEESTADLADIIEDLLLSCDKDFRTMISDCVMALPLGSPAELVGRV